MIVFSDSKKVSADYFLEKINISDKEKQDLHFEISEKIESIFFSKSNSILSKVFGLSLTRFSLQRNQFLIPYLISEKVSNILGDEDCRIILSKKNKLLGEYLKLKLGQKHKIKIQYHNDPNFWKNGLTRQPLVQKIFSGFFVVLAALYCSILILIFRNIKKKQIDIEWMSYANNKEAIDYSILDMLKAKGVFISFPGLIPYQNKYSNLMFRSREYSIVSFLKFIFDLFVFIFNENLQIKDFDNKYPSKFNLSTNSIFVLIYQYFLSFETNELESVAIFRGGNANGIWSYSLKDKRKTILLSHGTEIYPLDHAIYRYVDFYILPSLQIAEKWLKHDKKLSSDKLIPLGRPFYETLRLIVDRVIESPKEKKIIGIVLTYSSDERTKEFITDIYESFKVYDNVMFLIKERTNFKNDIGFLSNYENVKVHEGDIFSFFTKTNLVVAGISDYSVLGMTVLDAISLGIPAIYFTQNRKKSELGYSYCHEMEDFTFYNKIDLNELINKFDNIDFFLNKVLDLNKSTKLLLGPNIGVIEKFVDFVLNILNNGKG